MLRVATRVVCRHKSIGAQFGTALMLDVVGAYWHIAFLFYMSSRSCCVDGGSGQHFSERHLQKNT